MKVNSISIVPQDIGCNAKCKYCIAHMTKSVRDGMKKPGISLPKLEKCLKFAKDNGASTAIITSSGETLLGSWTNIENILWLCNKYFGQIDLHTNGSEITNEPESGRDFDSMIAPYITNITITLPHYKPEKIKELMWCDYHINMKSIHKLFKRLKNLGLSIRLSCVLCKDGISNIKDIHEYICYARNIGVDSIVLRELWIPKITKGGDSFTQWCMENQVPINKIEKTMKKLSNCANSKKFAHLYENGQPLDYSGIALSWSTCTTNNNKERIKSLVYRPDNHLYPDWDTKWSIM